MDTCKFCDKTAQARGLCINHYNKEKYAGRINQHKKKRISDVQARLTKYSLTNPSTGCIEWIGSMYMGYGLIGINGKTVSAHRAAYILAYGDIPKGKCVLHKCDNPSCINTDHLFIGTQSENMRDMDSKGRRAKIISEAHQNSKLRSDQVNAIRSDSRRNVEIARFYGVSPSLISNIKLGRARKYD